MYFFPFQVLLISDEERREVIPDSRAFWPQFHPLQSYIIWFIDWLVSNNTSWYDKLNSAVTSPRLPLDKNNTFAVVKFLTVNLPPGHPCKLYTARNVMTVGNIFHLYPICVESQLNKFCYVENYLWSAPYAIKIFIRCILGRRDVMKGNFHGILQ